MKKLALIVLVLFAPTAFADWVLNQKLSSLSFLTTKNASVTEKHTFNKMSGSLSDEGLAKLVIQLNSVETGVPIRNERMKELLFQIERFPEALVELKFDKTKLDSLKAGQMMDLPVTANLKLHGIERSMDANLRIIKLTNAQVSVTTVEPIIMNTEWFGLQAGVEKLREIVNLQSITGAVPVTLSLVYNLQ
jgi:polyisoprenoid-binding protein YceI